MTYTLSLLWAAFIMGLSSYVDLTVSKISGHLKADRSQEVLQTGRVGADFMAQPAASDSTRRTRRVIHPNSPLGEPEDYARVGLNDYYRDLDRCVIPLWTPEMDLLPVWQYECVMVLMETPLDLEGNRLVHLAARSANQHALAVLADLGVRLDAENYTGKTPKDVLRCYDDMNRNIMLARLNGTEVPVPSGSSQPGGMVATRPEGATPNTRTEL